MRELFSRTVPSKLAKLLCHDWIMCYSSSDNMIISPLNSIMSADTTIIPIKRVFGTCSTYQSASDHIVNSQQNPIIANRIPNDFSLDGFILLQGLYCLENILVKVNHF